MKKGVQAALVLAFLSVLAPQGRAELRNVLHYSKSGYFEHRSAVTACSTALEQLAAEFRFRVKHSADPHDLHQLKDYDLVIYDNTTDAGGVTNKVTPPQAALMEYMQGGGRFLGINGAIDHRSMWDWYDTVLFSGILNRGWTDGGFRVYKSDLSHSDTDEALVRMWTYAGDSLKIPTDSVSMNTVLLHYNTDALGKENIRVLQEIRGFRASDRIRQSHTWVKFLPGGGRMLFTALGYQQVDWTDEDSWLKKATYAYMRYLVGDFDVGPGALAPRIRTRGSRLEIRAAEGQNAGVVDIRGRTVFSGPGTMLGTLVLEPGVYFVSVGRAENRVSRTIVLSETGSLGFER